MKFENYDNFRNRIHESAKAKRSPLRAMFELTYRCNFRCPYCYIPETFIKESEKSELETKEICAIVDQLSRAGCLYLGFTGGEPFVRKDILDILRYAKRKGFEIIIYTNASLITEKIADELQKIKPNKVDITLNSLEKTRFEKISGMPGSYKSVLNGIGLLDSRKIPLGFKSCLLEDNYGEIEKIVKFAQTYRASYRISTMLMPRLNGSKEPYRYGRELERERAHVKGCDENDFSNKITPYKNKDRLFQCGVGVHNLAINPFGELKMCVHINYPRYNILMTSLNECWRDMKKLVDSIEEHDDYECKECQLRLLCKCCPARSWLDNGSFGSCVAECKRRAKYINSLGSPSNKVSISHMDIPLLAGRH